MNSFRADCFLSLKVNSARCEAWRDGSKAIAHLLWCGALFSAILLLSACGHEDPPVLTYKVGRVDYKEAVTVRGTVEAVKTHLISSGWEQGLQVISLAQDGEMVEKGDTVGYLNSPLDIENSQRSLQVLQADLSKLQIANAGVLAQLRLEMEMNKVQMTINEIDSLQRKFAPPLQQKLLDLRYQKARLLLVKLQKKYELALLTTSVEESRLLAKVRAAEKRLADGQRSLQGSHLVAPDRGMVMRVVAPLIGVGFGDGYAATYGGPIQEGSTLYQNTTVLQIPDMSKMQVVAMVPEIDYKRLRVGLPVTIQVEAVKNLFTTGRVERMTLEKVNPENQSGVKDSEVKRFKVILSVDSCHTRMTPGFSALCEMVIHEVPDTLVIPSVALFSRKGKKVVYLADGSRFRAVPVEVGFSNGSGTLIQKGIVEGQTIALMEPPLRLQSKE